MNLFERWFSGNKGDVSMETARTLGEQMLTGAALQQEVSASADPLANPLTHRMHVAELRPIVFAAAERAMKAEHFDLTEERIAVSRSLIDTFPRMADHESAGGTHMTFTELLAGAEVLEGTLKAFTDAYDLAHRQQ
jgi:hypothetical protein